MATYLYVGSFCPKGEAGYNIYRMDSVRGKVDLAAADVFPEISAGMTTFDAQRNILYCTDERPGNPMFQVGGGGRVFALAVDPKTGLLSKINESLSYGARPSYVALDPKREYLLVTNFGSSKHAGVPITKVVQDKKGNYRTVVDYEEATTVLLRLEPDGSIGRACDVIAHPLEGEPNPRIPHAHCVKCAPDGTHFAVCEMGTDKIYMLSIDREADKFILAGGEPYHYRKGYGPRYCAFHPEKPFLFVNTEDIPAVTSFRYDEQGTLEEICTVDVMPEGFEPTPELHSGFTISADGRFLYSTMRKFNIISVFSVDQESGKLTKIQTYQMAGSHPKDCVLSPNGRYLAVANRRSDDVEMLSVAEDGTLSPTDIVIQKAAAGLVFFLEFPD